jgi:PHP family Zn ribbon phosphoesterase
MTRGKSSHTRKKTSVPSRQWRVMDLHVHTPASADYQEPSASMLDLLRRAKARGLDILGITDHNTVAGYRKMRSEIEDLELLEKLGRLTAAEKERLEEYRSLLSSLLVLPGFEFTATFGFHIMAIFPPEKPVRELEYLLLKLNVPPEHLDAGSTTVGASSDVLTCYRTIDEAGGLVIAAHANSTNGVAMRGFPFGGQTKIAYTQDPHLHALEVTDLGQGGRRSTAGFFQGTKPEYPRRMHCIQGSDSHRLRPDPDNKKNLGVGDRATEILLAELSYEALREVFAGNDFARTRPHLAAADEAFDFIQQAREEGPSIVQAFHESLSTRGGKRYAIIADVCALANTNGGTLFVGLSADPREAPIGVQNAKQAVKIIEQEIAKHITPPLTCEVDLQETSGKTVLRVMIPRGPEPPYAVDDNKVYVREEVDTGVAVRDEIVQLVLRGTGPTPSTPAEAEEARQEMEPSGEVSPPRTGAEVVGFEERQGVRYYTVRDLRNSNVVKNVSVASARRLWHYAITRFEKLPQDPSSEIQWSGDLGVLGDQRKGRGRRLDLAQRTPEGIRLYFGVTEDGVHGEWKRVVGAEAE